jgi:hypothetical protein
VRRSLVEDIAYAVFGYSLVLLRGKPQIWLSRIGRRRCFGVPLPLKHITFGSAPVGGGMRGSGVHYPRSQRQVSAAWCSGASMKVAA